ncbi:MAG: biotin-dependent carboxyltransferase family protein [Gemmataceae bacterium]|nr:biotin-dependent carboxyltransferase family protein [Gemmataceae bacterium]MCS7270498.1 biotin-dependent carboxyltransferase family protein [Gemmataceae bacterium]MDW8242247.1 biotin-dependent carboxyltransferase family protein [Thermogemmata sp.]
MTLPSGLRVVEAGVYSLVVDGGRPHTRHWGVPLGGAADRASWQLGNALIGNTPTAPALEITLGGTVLQALGPVALTLCGAPFTAFIDGQPLPVGCTVALRPGQHLQITGSPRGVRVYLCVAGGFMTPCCLGSHSAWHPVRPGDILPCASATITRRRRLPDELLGQLLPAESGITCRVVDGPQRSWFPGDAFFQDTYTVLPATNRMGVRLHGPPLPRPTGELLSEPVAPGAVQITHDGQPIILGVDAQTIGGYPKIAHVIRADLDKLGQLRPGDLVRFVPVSREQAEQAAHQRRRWLQQWLDRLLMAEGTPVFVNQSLTD